MAKYRKASEGSKKGISTDKLSLTDAKEYFNSRAKETGAKRFRWNGDVYDLSGNKVSEAPARSSRGGSSASEGPKRPKANPARQPGGARPEPGKAAGMPAASGKGKPESPGKRGEVNPAVVGAMGAAAVGAGVAAARSGRNTGGRTTGGGSAQTGRNALPKPETRLALPAPNRGGTIIPPASKPKALPKPTVENGGIKAEPKAKPAAKPKGGARGGGRVGGASIGRQIRSGRGGRILQMPDVLNYQHVLNKGGLVKKKK